MLSKTDPQVALSISQDDFEEAMILANFLAVVRDRDLRMMNQTGQGLIKSPSIEVNEDGYTAAEVAQLAKFEALLGYDPREGRTKRRQGRVREAALPRPLPKVGTIMTSCLGERYTILMYSTAPRSNDRVTYVTYDDGRDLPVTRSVANLMAGHLPSGVALVTWEGDTRKLTKQMVVPMSRRRTLTRAELRSDQHADPSTLPLTLDEKRRRGLLPSKTKA